MEGAQGTAAPKPERQKKKFGKWRKWLCADIFCDCAFLAAMA